MMAALVLLPAGTLDYWQAWVFMSVFVGASGAVTVYLALHDPMLLERRMRAGPAAEKETAQKVIISLAMMGFIALLVVPAFDRRFGWSRVPAYLCLTGDALIAIGFLLVFFVIRVNTYAASTIQVTEDQSVISTGPYAFVRHPMYAGSFPILIGTPLALGSWWGLSALIVLVPALVWRLVHEESFLRKNLPGYTEYTHKVRYRLLPYLW
jgi:protein-S-isoprenylcysteine O-methyltransferase Ste14